MKTLLMLGSAMALALSASAVELTSSNVLGIQQVKGKLSEVTVSMPFTGVAGENAKLSEAVYTDNRALADSFKICENDHYGYFSQWVYLGNSFSTPFFPVSRTERFESIVPSDASKQIVPRGLGLSVSVGDVSSPVYVVGEYSETHPQTTILPGKRSFLANPLTEPFSLDEKLTSSLGVSLYDEIHISNGSATTIYLYSKTGDGTGKHWYHEVQLGTSVDENGRVISKKQHVYDGVTIPVNGSFYYFRDEDEDPLTFTW